MGFAGGPGRGIDLSNDCTILRLSIAALALNPYHHGVSEEYQEKIKKHLKTCPSCRGYKGAQVRARKKMGHDSTHQVI